MASLIVVHLQQIKPKLATQAFDIQHSRSQRQMKGFIHPRNNTLTIESIKHMLLTNNSYGLIIINTNPSSFKKIEKKDKDRF